jgi:hypothetical protein
LEFPSSINLHLIYFLGLRHLPLEEGREGSLFCTPAVHPLQHPLSPPTPPPPSLRTLCIMSTERLLLLFLTLGALLMGGGTLEYSNTGRLNSLKRPLNSNGKSQTGVGLNHETLIDQFVMHTTTGKVYIPSGTLSSLNALLSGNKPIISPCRNLLLV